MGKFIDLSGQKFGKLTVKEVYERSSRQAGRSKKIKYTCICECGNETCQTGTNLKQGKVVSCGCAKKERIIKYSTTHNQRYQPIYKSWSDMKSRCDNPKNKRYEYYGGRGIKYQESWSNFENFFKDMSPDWKEGLTLERLNLNRGYQLSNCTWASKKEQNRNKRNNFQIKYNGISKCLSEWAEEYGIKQTTLRDRIVRLNWHIDKALNTPVKKIGAK